MSGSASMPTASGSFDHPPATDDPAALYTDYPVENTSQSLRAELLETRGAIEVTVAEDHGMDPMSLWSSSSPNTQLRMRNVLRTFRHGRVEDLTQVSRDMPPTESQEYRSELRRSEGSYRLRALSAERQRRHRRLAESRRQMSRMLEEDGDLLPAVNRLSQINADLRSMLDEPITDPMPPPYVPFSAPEDFASLNEEQGRRKRRKTDGISGSGAHVHEEYGYKGQVVPGKLRMQLVSCDGGIMEDTSSSLLGDRKSLYCAANILEDDQTVYCTSSPRCNIVLRHDGETTFTLERLVIKAPKSGFTDPVQEGLIFVSMRKNHVFDRTAKYQIFDLPTSRFARHFASAATGLHRAKDDPNRLRRHTIQPTWGWQTQGNGDFDMHRRQTSILQPLRADDESDTSSVSESESVAPEHDEEEDGGEDLDEDDDVDSDDQLEHEAEARESQSYFDEVLRRGAVASADRHERAESRRRYRTSTVGSEHARLGASDSAFAERREPFQTTGGRGTAGETTNSANPGTSANSFGTFMTDESLAARAFDIDLLAPIASFSMRNHDKKKVIKFKPPLAAKFVLIKLWNPRKNGNIDVQSIVAHGFAGTQFVPAFQMA